MAQQKTRQSTLNAFVGKSEIDSSSSSSIDYGSESEAKKIKGSQWSRIKCREQLNAKRTVVFDFDEDLKRLLKEESYKKQCSQDADTFLFDPDEFNRDQNGYNLEDYELSTEDLLHFAKLSTQIRKKFVEKAKTVIDQQMLRSDDVEEEEIYIPHTLRRCYVPKTQHAPKSMKFDFKDTQNPARTKTKNLRQLSIEMMNEIVDAVLVEKLTHRETAERFNVTKMLVNKLVKERKEVNQKVNDLELKEKQRVSTLRDTKYCVQQFIDRSQMIWQTQQIVDSVKDIFAFKCLKTRFRYELPQKEFF